MTELEEKMNCIFADIGSQVGELLRCMVTAEVETHMARIAQLQAVLRGEICSPVIESPSPQLGEVPPAT